MKTFNSQDYFESDLYDMNLSDYVQAIKKLIKDKVDISAFQEGYYNPIFEFPFVRERNSSTEVWDELFESLSALWTAHPKIVNIEVILKPLYGELDSSLWNKRLAMLNPFVLKSIEVPMNNVTFCLSKLISDLWWMRPMPSELTNLIKELEALSYPSFSHDREMIDYLLNRRSKGTISLDRLKNDPLGCFLGYIKQSAQLDHKIELSVFLSHLNLILPSLFEDDFKDLRLQIKDRREEYYEALFCVLDLKNESLSQGMVHWIFGNGRFVSGYSVEELDFFALNLNRLINSSPGLALSILNVARHCKHESPNLTDAFLKQSKDSTLSIDQRDFCSAARLLYLFHYSPEKRKWSKEIGEELINKVSDRSWTLSRSVAGYLFGLYYSENLEQSSSIKEICSVIVKEQKLVPGPAGPFVEGIKKSSYRFRKLTDQSLMNFAKDMLDAESTKEIKIDMKSYFWHLDLPTLQEAILGLPSPSLSDSGGELVPDPTSPLSSEFIENHIYSDDQKLQPKIALKILKEKFPNIDLLLLYQQNLGDGSNWNQDCYYFFNQEESFQVRRTLFGVIFNNSRQGNDIEIICNEILELYENKKGLTFYFNLPSPLGSYSNLVGLRACILTKDCKLGVEDEVIELSKPNVDQLLTWTNNFVPDQSLDYHLKFLDLKLGDHWHEAFPDTYILTWLDFLRAYGQKQQGDWVNDFIDGFENKRKFVIAAIKEADLIPMSLLPMIGVGPLEDIMCSEVMNELELIEREEKDLELRLRLKELIAGIYVHGDAIEIGQSWMTLIKKLSTEDELKSFQNYFHSLGKIKI